MMLLKSIFYLKMNQNDFFLFLTSMYQNNKKTRKSIILMLFQAKINLKNTLKSKSYHNIKPTLKCNNLKEYEQNKT
jgi:hypothetical protein